MDYHILIDQMGRTVRIPVSPQRIISLVPSQTELLADLGLESRVVGITKFCIHPNSWFRTKKRIGGSKKVNLDAIQALQPDLIIGNKEENSKADIEALEKQFPVWMSDIYTLEDSLQMIEQLGLLTQKTLPAYRIQKNIQIGFENLSMRNKTPFRVAYFIWKDPYMVVANHTLIHHMIERAGWINVFENQSRYPIIKLSDLAKLEVDAILLSSEPYPFADKHMDAFRSVCPKAHIQLVDGELFSWHGSRLQYSPPYFKQLTTLFEQYSRTH